MEKIGTLLFFLSLISAPLAHGATNGFSVIPALGIGYGTDYGKPQVLAIAGPSTKGEGLGVAGLEVGFSDVVHGEVQVGLGMAAFYMGSAYGDLAVRYRNGKAKTYLGSFGVGVMFGILALRAGYDKEKKLLVEVDLLCFLPPEMFNW